MKNSVFLIRKYWSKNKSQGVTILISTTLMVALIMVLLFCQISEYRRILHSQFDDNGSYDSVIMNAPQELLDSIESESYIKEYEKVYAFGTIGNEEDRCVFGALDSKSSHSLIHLSMIDGTLPQSVGEIALSESVIDELNCTNIIGQEVTFNTYDISGDEVGEKTWKLVGIIKDISTRNDVRTDNYMGSIYTTPTAYVSLDELGECSNTYVNLLYNKYESQEDVISYNEDETSTESEDFYSRYENLGTFISGGRRMVLSSFLDDNQSLSKDSNIYAIQIFSMLTTIISIISMWAGISSVMPKRIESFRLLKCIGYSNKMLLKLLLLESLAFFAISSIFGAILGIGLYYVIYLIQVYVCGLSSYSGYTYEWIVSQISLNPYYTPMLLGLLSFVLGYMPYLVKLSKLTVIESTYLKVTNHRSINTLRKTFEKVILKKSVIGLQFVSIFLFVVVCIGGYLFFSNENKGTSQFSVGNNVSDSSYYEVNGVNLLDNNIDCNLKAPTGSINIATIDYGCDYQTIATLSEDPLVERVIASGEISVLPILYPKGSFKDIPKYIQSIEWTEVNHHSADFMEYYGLSDYNVFASRGYIVTDDITTYLNEFVTSGNINLDDLNSGNVIMVESNYMQKTNYNVGDTIELVSMLTDGNTSTNGINVNFENRHIYNTTVSAIVQLPEDLSSMDSIVLSLLGIDVETYENYNDSFFIFTGKGVETLGVYKDTFDNVNITTVKDTTQEDLENLLNRYITYDMVFTATTKFQCDRNLFYAKVGRYSSIVLLYIMLILMTFFGYSNIVSMQIQNSKYQLNVLYSIGLSKSQLRKNICTITLKVPLIACACGIVTSLCFKAFLKSTYNDYLNLLETQQYLLDNYDYPNVIINCSLTNMEVGTDMYTIT